jgi:hypothetical protein
MPTNQCPLCNQQAEFFTDLKRGDTYDYRCVRCGRFAITGQAFAVLKSEEKLPLSCMTRIASETASGEGVRILSDNIAQLISTLPSFSPPEKLDNLLQLIGDKSKGIGQKTSFRADTDYPLLAPFEISEVQFMLNELHHRGFIASDIHSSVVTMKGWERLEQIRHSGRSSTRCFVAMWFSPSMQSVYDNAIAIAITAAGYNPLRIDKHEHVNRVDDEIVGQIRRSRFMVADFTGQRGGVYFEAGLMQGLGRHVIWMCRREELENSKLHFDVRQFNFIGYSSDDEARKRLYDRILAIEGEGPRVTSAP